ncbi:MAG: hypothetical protein ACJA2S_005079 [Cyclobacteriaceae bacterium]|jgi:hypothetical protein
MKFFKKIRQQLLTKNKFRNYLIYAIGEIILVVIGILIALSIDNHNEDVQRQKTVKLYLENFVEDLKEDQETMRDALKVHNFRYHSLQYVLMQIGEDIYDPTTDELLMPEYIPSGIWTDERPLEYNKEFIGLAFLWSHRSVSQNLNTATIDELKSTGFFSYIKNHELKNAINGYYDYWSHRLGERNQTKFHNQVKEWEASLGEEGLMTNMFLQLDDPLEAIKDNPKRVYLLKVLIREAAWIHEVGKGVIEYAQGLIDYIENNYLMTSMV